MPGLAQRNAQSCNAPAVGSVLSNGIWSKHHDEITFDQLQKFWSELPPHARQELLRIDKQTLFEQARKSLYCSRCNGLLLEGFTQIVMYGKSLQQEGGSMHLTNRTGLSKNQIGKDSVDVQDPSMHPWGGLSTTRDGILTLLDCYTNSKSLKALQNVFDSARARERERELLYPDACGGGGRGWISQGITNYSRGHGTRETCALHTTRLSCDTLVDFWSALGDETRLSLLRMKEEDFIERLMYRDCRRNVIREFKELKELKRMRKEPCCTNWFCVADTAFQYEVSEDTVQADWHQSFTDIVGTYHHFEWAIGTGEGKSDILDFEDVGMNGKVQVNGLDLAGLSACFITLRAWKLDGRCTELSVKAHALKGQPCVHRRLVVGDGFVTITKGESIRRFFEHAEEAEEEEDDDTIDKDGNEFDGDGSRPQKHAKSPELAREFLLDAATVIFKEQVEKAFREGTARQNAHSIFVCLSLNLLEERVHVACKEIITLEKQIKLLEEEEREKCEEEERKERRRTKEREKKHRRKERLKGKDRDRDRKHIESKSLHTVLSTSVNDTSMSAQDEPPNAFDSRDSNSKEGAIMPVRPVSPDIIDGQSSNGCINSKMQNLKGDNPWQKYHVDGEFNSWDCNGSFIVEQSKASRRKSKFKKDSLLDQDSKWYDKHRSSISNECSVQHAESETRLRGGMRVPSRCTNGVNRLSRGNFVKTNARSGLKFSEKFHCSNNRARDRFDFHSCNCDQHGNNRAKEEYHISTAGSGRSTKTANKTESTLDMPRPFYRSSKYSHGCYIPDNGIISKGKLLTGNIPPSRDVVHTKQVWEPMDSRKKCNTSICDPVVTLTNALKVDQSVDVECDKLKSPDDRCLSELPGNLSKADSLNRYQSDETSRDNSNKPCLGTFSVSQNGFLGAKSSYYSKDGIEEEADPCSILSTYPSSNSSDPIMSSSSSDNCSSCLSEGDSSTSSSSVQNAESSSTSDSEDASQQSDGRGTSACTGNTFHTFPDDVSEGKYMINGGNTFTRTTSGFPVASSIGVNFPRDESTKVDMAPQQQHMLPMHNQSIHVPIFPSPTMGYNNQSAASCSAAPTNGLVPFTQPNGYVFPSPLGYGITTNQDFCMQYSSLQPLTTHTLNVGQHPLHQITNKANFAVSKEETKNSKICGAEQGNGVTEVIGSVHSLGRSFPNGELSSKPPSAGQNGIIGNAAKSNNESSSFSLFHFGGPMAGATGYSMNPVSSKEENIGRFSSISPAVQADLTCSKKETRIEEYCLFAASNGARFSFF